MCYFGFNFYSIFIVLISVLLYIRKEMSIFFFFFFFFFCFFPFFFAKYWNGNVLLVFRMCQYNVTGWNVTP